MFSWIVPNSLYKQLVSREPGGEAILFTNCREEVFSETGLPVYRVLGNSVPPPPRVIPLSTS